MSDGVLEILEGKVCDSVRSERARILAPTRCDSLSLRARARSGEPLSYKWLAHAAGISTSDAQGVLQRYAASHAADGPGAVDAQYIEAERAPSTAARASARCVTCGSCARISSRGRRPRSRRLTAVHVYSIHLRRRRRHGGRRRARAVVGRCAPGEGVLRARGGRRARVPEQRALVDRVRRRHDRAARAPHVRRRQPQRERPAAAARGSGASESGGGPQLRRPAPQPR